MKILIVEDEIELQNIMVEFLSKEHYLLEVATKFSEGLEKISLYQYACILLDITLPDGTPSAARASPPGARRCGGTR